MRQADTNALLAIRNAIENASNGPVSDATIVAILRGEITSGAQLGTIFEDNSLQALARAGRAAGVTLPTILHAYAAIRATTAVANPGLDKALEGDW